LDSNLTGGTLRLTFAHKGGRSLADDPLSAGIPSYVMQEEFSRYQGYWWQPRCTGKTWRVLVEKFEMRVSVCKFVSKRQGLMLEESEKLP